MEKIFCFEEETHLTVHKTSIFVPGGGDGFIVYNPTWEMTFRVDSYGPDSASKDELVLMDSSGKSLVTLLRKVGARLHLLFDYSPLSNFDSFTVTIVQYFII